MHSQLHSQQYSCAFLLRIHSKPHSQYSCLQLIPSPSKERTLVPWTSQMSYRTNVKQGDAKEKRLHIIRGYMNEERFFWKINLKQQSDNRQQTDYCITGHLNRADKCQRKIRNCLWIVREIIKGTAEGIPSRYLKWYYLNGQGECPVGESGEFIRNTCACSFNRCFRLHTPFTILTQSNISCLIDVVLLRLSK